MIVRLSCFNRWLCSSWPRLWLSSGVGLRCCVCRTSVSVVVSLLWIVAVTNAINFIDNMDGLAGGLGFVAAMAFGCPQS